MLLYDAVMSRISKVVPPFFLKERVGARATTTQVAHTHNTFTSNKILKDKCQYATQVHLQFM